MIGALLTGCAGAFVQRISPEQSVIDHARRSAYEKGIAEGTSLGMDICKAKTINLIREDIEALKAFQMYDRLVRGGVVVPPRIVTIVSQGGVSRNGKQLTAPSLSMIIQKEAYFTDTSFLKRLADSVTVYLVGFYENQQDAQARLKAISKQIDRKDSAEITQTDKGDYALIIWAFSNKDYSFLGLKITNH